jgi:predicted Zn-dependent protease
VKKHALLLGVALFAISAKKPEGLPAAQPMTAKDKQVGAKAHEEILAEFGGAYAGPQANYVRGVGQKVAVQSGLSNSQSDFTITLINSPVNNAFAIPGGYVYVTRQLLALMNNEAELASVLGHEVGHVAARHSAKRNSRAQMGGLAAMGATILGGLLGGGQGAQLGQQLGGQLATRWVMGFSRAQEYQADDLGVSYIAKTGYDPIASSTMLASLAAQTSLDARILGRDEKALPQWASTHPDPASRVVRAQQKAGAAVAAGKATNRDAFLAALDGILYDDDPKQGVVDGREFRHPELKLAFTAPVGFAMVNSPQAVTVSGSTGRASFSGGKYEGDLRGYVSNVFAAIGKQNNVTLTPSSIDTVTINGLPAARATAEVAAQSGPMIVTVYAYEFARDQAFHIFSLTPAASRTAFDSLFQSVRRLSAQEAAAVRPRRIDVVTVKSGDTSDKLAARMAYDTLQLERFRVLNALPAGENPRAGSKVKLVVYQQ